MQFTSDILTILFDIEYISVLNYKQVITAFMSFYWYKCDVGYCSHKFILLKQNSVIIIIYIWTLLYVHWITNQVMLGFTTYLATKHKTTTVRLCWKKTNYCPLDIAGIKVYKKTYSV